MFWRQFFLEASQGRTQRSLFIDSNGNIYKFNKRKNQKPLLSIDEKSPEEIINGAKEFLSKIIGKSGRELLPQEYIAPKTWTGIRKKAIQEILILEAICKLVIPQKEKKELFKRCLSLMELDMLAVVYENGCVQRMMQKTQRHKRKQSRNL